MSVTEAWWDLGQAGRLVVETATLAQVDLPFVAPMRTAAGTHQVRPLVLVRLAGTVDGVPFQGWGECAALAGTFYNHEDVAVAWAALEETLIPALFEDCGQHRGHLPPPSRLTSARREGQTTPLAFAALEMAVADAHLRVEQRSFANLIGVVGHNVEVGAVLGQLDSVEDVATEAARFSDLGITRLKLKIGPGWDREPLEAITRAVPGMRLQADANGSYGPDDTDDLVGLDRFQLLCVEQPFDRLDVDAHVRLAERLRTPVCLDESVDSPDSVRRALDVGACSVVCIKPARLGGIGATLGLMEWCAGTTTPMWMGGMFEGGFGRGVNIALSALPGLAWPGDLSPARWYLGDDLVAEPALTRAAPSEPLTASPSRYQGMGPAPDPVVLDRYMSRVLEVQA